jgi:hypothetical protein
LQFFAFNLLIIFKSNCELQPGNSKLPYEQNGY